MPNFIKTVAVFTVCLFAFASSVLGQQQTRYTVLMMGQPAGTQVSLVKPDGVREFVFEYSDRGRGPKITSHLKLDTGGLPVSLEILGNDYWKAPGCRKPHGC
jgi:hypothetical protein